MTTEEVNMDVIRRWNEEGWSKGHYDVAYELVGAEFKVHGAGGQVFKQGPEAVIDLIRTWREAFPDGEMTIDDLFAEGDLVCVRNTWRGTHTGDFYGNPPSGKRVEVSSIGIDRVVDGKIVEGWGELNMLSLMQQIGAIPGPGSQETTAGASAQG